MSKKTVHMGGFFGGTPTWCGRVVGEHQLPILGTRRTANCIACARTTQAKEHAQRWGYSYARRWRSVLLKNQESVT